MKNLTILNIYELDELSVFNDILSNALVLHYNSKFYYPSTDLNVSLTDGQIVTFSTRPYVVINSGEPTVKIKLLYFTYHLEDTHLLTEMEKILT